MKGNGLDLHRASSVPESSKKFPQNSSLWVENGTLDSEKCWKENANKSHDDVKSICNTVTKRMVKAKQKLDSLIGNETSSKLILGDHKLKRSQAQVTCGITIMFTM